MIEVEWSEPFIKWMGKLKDPRAKALIEVRIKRLKDGNSGDTGPVAGDIFEMRIDYGPGYRVYCLGSGKRIVVLLCGGEKSTQDGDIARAKRVANIYRQGKGR